MGNNNIYLNNPQEEIKTKIRNYYSMNGNENDMRISGMHLN
jgi:hypothetical protein